MAWSLPDALAAPQSPDGQKRGLDRFYGDAGERSPRYVDFPDRVARAVGEMPGGVLHDVGCGNGKPVFEARRRGWRAQGSDAVPGVKPFLEENGIPCYIGSLADQTIEPESCDVITSFCVLPHHLTEPTPDMLAVHRMLKPGGWFVLQLPNAGLFRKITTTLASLLRPFGKNRISGFLLAQMFGPGGHQFGFNQNNLAEYLRQCGFSSVSFEAYYPSTRYALARFHNRPLWSRAGIAAAVNAVQLTGRVFGLPNHIIAYARK